MTVPQHGHPVEMPEPVPRKVASCRRLSNIALSALDDYFVDAWNSTMKDGNARYRRRQRAWRTGASSAMRMRGSGVNEVDEHVLADLPVQRAERITFDQSSPPWLCGDDEHDVGDVVRPCHAGDLFELVTGHCNLSPGPQIVAAQRLQRLGDGVTARLNLLSGWHQTGVGEPVRRSVNPGDAEHGDAAGLSVRQLAGHLVCATWERLNGGSKQDVGRVGGLLVIGTSSQ